MTTIPTTGKRGRERPHGQKRCHYGDTYLARLCLCVLASVSVGLALLASPPTRAQSVTNVNPGEPAVEAAIAKAQSTLSTFFRLQANPGPGKSGFSVKIKLPKKATTGNWHVWGENVVRSGDTVTATLASNTRADPDYAPGQRVTAPLSQISDWLYWENGKMRGAYTVRALLPFMSPEEADRSMRLLGPE